MRRATAATRPATAHLEEERALLRVGLDLLGHAVARPADLDGLARVHLLHARERQHRVVARLARQPARHVLLVALALRVREVVALVVVQREAELALVAAQVVAQQVRVLGDVRRLQRQLPQPLAPVDALLLRIRDAARAGLGPKIAIHGRPAPARTGEGTERRAGSAIHWPPQSLMAAVDALGVDVTARSPDPYVQLSFSTAAANPAVGAHAHNSRLLRVGANFVNTVVGAGIVGLPHTLKRSGFGLGLGMMLLACCLTHYSLTLLVRLSVELRVTTYEQVCFAAFGRPGYVLVCAALLVFDFGACLSYLLIMADAAARAAAQLWPGLGAHDGAARQYVLLGLAPLLLLLCLQRDLSALERWSALSVLLCVLLAAFVGWQYLALDGSLAGGQAGAPLSLASAGFGSAFGTVAFSFVNNDTALLLFATLRKPTQRRWALLSAGSLALALLICASFAVLGYLTFRENVSDNLLNDYPSDTASALGMRLLYALSMATTYAVLPSPPARAPSPPRLTRARAAPYRCAAQLPDHLLRRAARVQRAALRGLGRARERAGQPTRAPRRPHPRHLRARVRPGAGWRAAGPGHVSHGRLRGRPHRLRPAARALAALQRLGLLAAALAQPRRALRLGARARPGDGRAALWRRDGGARARADDRVRYRAGALPELLLSPRLPCI